jgi:DNA mismatch repair protein MutL
MPSLTTPADPTSTTRKVRVLAAHLINQIAAGEVVERPSSVVKELVENAIDAGAREIDIELEAGGRTLIEVRDDGSGMSADDALTAMQRHATSKIRAFEDLLAVGTLGFRGEALPSIASVSRFTLTTFDGESDAAVEIHAEPGAAPSVRPTSRARGTTIRVAELFENVPARRKFLKSSDAEFRSIVQVVSSYALPLFDRSFRLAHNGRVVLDFVACSDAAERVVQVLGSEVRAHLQPIDYRVDRVAARGFVTRGLRYGSKRNQFFFVNDRLVRDRVLTHAASRAADAFDFEGHPAIVLFLDVPRELVDVNVHPAKTEVRFRDSGLAHVVVERGVKEALGGPTEGGALLNRVQEGPDDATAPFFAAPLDGRMQNPDTAQQSTFSGAALDAPLPREVRFDVTPLFRNSAATVQPPRIEPAPLGDLRGRIIGQYRLSYILVDMPEGLRLIDQHVAHERVLYDRIAARYGDNAEAQTLLTPLLFEASAAECAIIDSHVDELRSVGFELERFSGNSFAISSVPTVLRREEPQRFLRKLIDTSLEEKHSPMERLRDRVIASLACQAAIKVHRPLSGEEMARVVAEVLDSSNPYACPHGRPIIVDIRHLDIERHFHRK